MYIRSVRLPRSGDMWYIKYMKIRLDLDDLVISRLIGIQEDLQISQKALNLLILITEYAIRWRYFDKPLTTEYIADVLNYSNKTIYNALSELRKKELLETRVMAGSKDGYMFELNDAIFLLINEEN